MAKRKKQTAVGPYDPTTGLPWTKEAFYAANPNLIVIDIPDTPTTSPNDPERSTDKLQGIETDTTGSTEDAGQLRNADDEQTNTQPLANNPPQAETAEQGEGDIASSTTVAGPTARDPPRETQSAASHRWRREGRDQEVAIFRDRVREEYTRLNPGCKRRDAHEWAWQTAIDSFPPGATKQPPEPPTAVLEASEPESDPADRVQGLGRLPFSWDVLPDNASLQAELSWVQSQRLRCVEERGNSVIVRLERASCPAPSMAALGWLETSIRSYAKFVDVVSRTLAVVQDEQEHTRRERLRLDEIRALLDEMQG